MVGEAKGGFRIYISQLLVDEASAGDPVEARERMKVIQNFPLLDITPDAGVLASEILDSGIIPGRPRQTPHTSPSLPCTAWTS